MVDRKLPKKRHTLRENLTSQLAERAEGMFLYVKLQQNNLGANKNERQLERIVRNMPDGLDGIYRKNWDIITSKSKPDRDRAFAIFNWLLLASRTLSVSELTEALAVPIDVDRTQEKGDDFIGELPDYIDESYVDEELVDICGSLIEARKGGSESVPAHWSIHFVHPSAREFVLTERPAHPTTRSPCLSILYHTASMTCHHSYLARVCLSYLSFENIFSSRNIPCLPEGKPQFLDYAVRFWHVHANEVLKDDDCVVNMVRQFFGPENASFKRWAELFEASQDGITQDMKDLGTPMYYAALLNLSSIVEDICQNDQSQLNTLGGKHGTPLQAACIEGNHLSFRILMQHGADINVEAGKCGFAIVAAARQGLKDMITALVDNGALIDSKGARGLTAIGAAATNGHFDTVKSLLDRGADITIPNENGWTPVHSAAANGHFNIVKLLLDHGADIAAPNARGWTSLNFAAESGHLEIVKLLLDRGEKPTVASSEGWTPLNSAADNGHLEVVQLLIDRGADLTVSNNYGWTPLNSAAESGHSEVVQLLLGHGADPAVPNSQGGTALYWAALQGHLEVVRLLLDHGEDARAPQVNGFTPISAAAYNGHLDVVGLLLNKGQIETTIADTGGKTTLYSAAVTGNVEIIRLHLDHGDGAGAPGFDAFSSIRAAVKMGHSEAVRLLLDRGQINTTIADTDRGTPLYWAVKTGNVEITRLLLDYGEYSGDTSVNGYSLICIAVENGHVEVVRLLIERCADTKVLDGKGVTPLHHAARQGHLEILQLLLANNVDVNEYGTKYCTALQAASCGGSYEIVQALLAHDAEINIQGGRFGTAHLAASFNGHFDVLRLLVEEHHAGITLVDCLGRNALHLAARGGHVDCFDFLVEKGLDYTGRDRRGDTILHYAASGGSLTIVRKILKAYPTISCSANVWSPLHWAYRSAKSDVRRLLQDDFSDEVAVKTNDPRGQWTPLSIGLFHCNENLGDSERKFSNPSALAQPAQRTEEVKGHRRSEGLQEAERHGRFSCDGCFHVSFVFRCDERV